MAGHVYVICSIGAEGDPIRKRADELCDYVVAPVAAASELSVARSDRDPTPGQITTQILQGILDATVVVADLTGRNPNVFYELAFAQSFGKPTILLVDKAETLPFDARNERVIEIGDAGTPISLQQGEDAKKKLKGAFDKVLEAGYTPASLITQVAGTASLAKFEPDNPVAAELAAVKDLVLQVLRRQQAIPVPRSINAERRAMRELLESLVAQGLVSNQELDGLIAPDTSASFNRWVEAQVGSNPYREKGQPAAAGDIDPDDIPF